MDPAAVDPQAALLSGLDMFNTVLTTEVPGILGSMLGAMELQQWRNQYGVLDDLSRIRRATGLGFSNLQRLGLGMRGASCRVLLDIRRAGGGALQSELCHARYDSSAWRAVLPRLEGSNWRRQAKLLRDALDQGRELKSEEDRVLRKVHAAVLFGHDPAQQSPPPGGIHVRRVDTLSLAHAQDQAIRLELHAGPASHMHFDGWLRRCAEVLDLGEQSLDVALFDLSEMGQDHMVTLLDNFTNKSLKVVADAIKLRGMQGDYSLARAYCLSLPAALRDRLSKDEHLYVDALACQESDSDLDSDFSDDE